MADAFAIAPGFEVVGSDGVYVGRVDKLEGEDIKLAARDSETGGQHRFIPVSWVEEVDAAALKVTLDRTRDDAERDWRTVQ
jgi:hypothetical protein